jgi:hypothetical protein
MHQASYACLITDTWHNEVESFINSQFLQSLTGRCIMIAEIWWSGGKLLSKLDQMEFKQLCFYGSRFRLEVVESSLEILLRSWVQIPPVHLGLISLFYRFQSPLIHTFVSLISWNFDSSSKWAFFCISYNQ